MIRVIFKNLEKSALAREAAIERIEPVAAKFPDLEGSRIHVTLEMQNSPHQAGPDLFPYGYTCMGADMTVLTLRSPLPTFTLRSPSYRNTCSRRSTALETVFGSKRGPLPASSHRA